MQFQPGDIFHVYNRGNNKQLIFFSENNYEFFLKKVQHFICPISDILAYCLMPNHFHFLIQANVTSCKEKRVGSLTVSELTNGLRLLQSTYASAINKNKGYTGSLFQQKAKFKLLSTSSNQKHDHLHTCLHYIHQNPLKAGLVSKMEWWKYSSFHEYLSEENEKLICNKDVIEKVIDIPPHLFYDVSNSVLDNKLLYEIF